jgi:inner membrane protein
MAADFLLDRLEVPWLVGGLIDEPAHLATAVLVKANLRPGGPTWTAGFTTGAVAPDLDHVPLIPRRHKIRDDDPRPAAHTLLTPAATAAAAFFTRAPARELLLGLAAGTCAHFVRDVATGTGLAPLQPLRRRRVRLPRRGYEVMMGLLAVRALFLRTGDWGLGTESKTR